MKKQERAEFDINDMLPIGITLIVVIIGLAIGLQVVGSVRVTDSITGCASRADGFTTTTSAGLCANSSGSTAAPSSAQYNATGEGITALQVLTSNLDTVALVIVAALIIGILIRYMMGR